MKNRKGDSVTPEQLEEIDEALRDAGLEEERHLVRDLRKDLDALLDHALGLSMDFELTSRMKAKYRGGE